MSWSLLLTVLTPYKAAGEDDVRYAWSDPITAHAQAAVAARQ